MIKGEKPPKQISGVDRILTGILTLDYALNGGIPLGSLTMIVGMESCGKSSLCMKILKENPDKKVFWFDAERSFEWNRAQEFGLNMKNIERSRPAYPETWIQDVKKLIMEKRHDIIVVDSIISLAPGEEFDREDGLGVGILARYLNSAWRQWSTARALADSDVNIILVNQLRARLVSYGPPEQKTIPGGMGQKYYNAVLIKLSADNSKEGIITNEAKVPVAVRIKFMVEKNKSGPQKMSGSFTLYTRKHADREVGNTEDDKAVAFWAEKYKVEPRRDVVLKTMLEKGNL